MYLGFDNKRKHEVTDQEGTWEAYDDKSDIVVDCRLTMPNMKDIPPKKSFLLQPFSTLCKIKYCATFVNLDSFCQNLLWYEDFITTVVI